MKKRYLLNILFGLVLFLYLEYRLGFRESFEALMEADLRSLGAAVLAFLLSQSIRLVKWRIFYRQARIRTTFGQVSHFYFKLKLFGILTPGRIGEFLPAVTSKSWKGPLLSFTTYDRLTESMTTLVIAVVAITYLLKGLVSFDILPVVLVLILLLGLTSYLCYRNAWMMGLARRVGDRMERYRHHRLVERVLSSEKRIAMEIRRVQRSFRVLFQPGTAAIVLSITLLAVLADYLFWWFLFRTIGVTLSPATLVASVVLFNVSGFFSPTPGGIGVSDTFFVYFLHSIGVQGAFGTFLVLLRLTLIVMTAACYFVLHFGIEARRARAGDTTAPLSG